MAYRPVTRRHPRAYEWRTGPLPDDLGYPHRLTGDYLEAIWPGGEGAISWFASIGGLTVTQGAIGYADVLHNVPMTPDIRTPALSVTKTYTSILAHVAEQRGLIGLDDAIGPPLRQPTYWYGYDATLRTLLSHREPTNRDSVPDINSLTNVRFPSSSAEVVQNAFYRPILQPSLGDGNPTWDGWVSTSPRYSNAGYDVAAAVLEKVFGKSYADLVVDYILGPMGLMRTDPLVHVNGVSDGRKIAEGWIAPEGKYTTSGWVEPGALAGSIGLAFSARELANTIGGTFLGGQVLDDVSRSSIVKPVPGNRPRDQAQMCHGVFRYSETPDIYGQDGGRPGFTCSYRVVPENGIVVAANSTSPHLFSPSVVNAITLFLTHAIEARGRTSEAAFDLLADTDGPWCSDNTFLRVVVGHLGRYVVSVSTNPVSGVDIRPIHAIRRPDSWPRSAWHARGFAEPSPGSDLSGHVYLLGEKHLRFGETVLQRPEILARSAEEGLNGSIADRLAVPDNQKVDAVLTVVHLVALGANGPAAAREIAAEIRAHSQFWGEQFSAGAEGRELKRLVGHFLSTQTDGRVSLRSLLRGRAGPELSGTLTG